MDPDRLSKMLAVPSNKITLQIANPNVGKAEAKTLSRNAFEQMAEEMHAWLVARCLRRMQEGKNAADIEIKLEVVFK